MKALANSPFGWLLKREYWESRRGFLRAPIVVSCVILVITILGIIAAEVGRARFHITHIEGGGYDLGSALHYAFARDADGLVHALDSTMLTFGAFIGIVLAFVLFFYFLGALYDDRRDRSILFWKSLPVSDTSTVISKVIAGAIIAPLIAAGVILAGYIAAQIVATIWFAAHGLNPFTLIWGHAEPYSVWLHMLAMVPVDAIWALPTIGWLLLWSAAVRSKPFLWAIVVPIGAGVLNFWIGILGLPHINAVFFWNKLAVRALLGVVPGGWVTLLHTPPEQMANASDAVRHFGSYAQMGQALITPEMWIGAIVGIALIAAAIWFRRWRDET